MPQQRGTDESRSEVYGRLQEGLPGEKGIMTQNGDGASGADHLKTCE